MALVAGWIVLAAVVVGLALLSFFIVKYYSDPHDSRWFSTLVTVIGLTLVLITCFLVPIDIWAVSSFKDAMGNFVVDADSRIAIVDAMSVLYAVIYCACLVVAFIFVPFAYFYFEAENPDYSWGQRVCSALKYTVFTICMGISTILPALLRMLI